MDIKSKIIEAIKDFIVREGKEPTTLYVSRIDEQDIANLNQDDIGAMAAKISKFGVRPAIIASDNKFMGLTVKWDAPCLKVE